MPKTAVALRHVAFEDPGLLAPVLAEAGWTLAIRDVGCDDLADPAVGDADLLIVLGGPIGVYEEAAYPFLADEIALLRARLAAKRPTLGICLGAQLIAAALGAEVAPTGVKEIGFAALDLDPAGLAGPLRHLAGVPVLHWHGDAAALPAGAERLATTAVCANQGFALGANVLGLQFHGEVDPRVGFERWLIGHACELAGAGIDPRVLRADARRHAASLTAAGRAAFAEWIAGLAI